MIDLNAPAWASLHAAGPNTAELLKELVEGTEDFRDTMEILAENLSHQLSFYNAAAYALPHLAALCSRLSLEEKAFLIGRMGAAIAAEAEEALPPDNEPWREFHEGLEGLRPVAKDLIENHMDVLEDLSGEEQQMFALGALAVLGNRKHAYGLYFLSGSCWEEAPAACTCGWEDECVLLAEEPDCLEPADIAAWDGKSLNDEAVWLSGLLSRFGEEMILSVLPLVYGTSVCPECGKREPYWAWFDRWTAEC